MGLESKTFCVLPWIHLFGDERGDIYPCCFSHESPVVDDRGNRLKVYETSQLEAAWSSKPMRDLRLEMLKGSRPAACSSCFANEDRGGRSYREQQNLTYGALIPELVAATSADGDAPRRYRFMDLRLGNACNLKCRMCSPLSSRLLVDEFHEIHAESGDTAWIDAHRNPDWFRRPEFWETLSRELPHLARLHFAGGEPFLIPEATRFLQRVIDEGHAGHIVLTYNTNLTLLPEKILEHWPKFRGVEIIASIDGFGPVNRYIRHPSQWHDIDRNLRLLDKRHRELNLRAVTVHTTVQAYNVLRLCELFEYLAAEFSFVLPYPALDLVQGRDWLDIRILTPELKAVAAARLEAFGAGLSPRTERETRKAREFADNLGSIINHMRSGDGSRNRPEFRRITSIFDRHRNESLLEVLPELRPVLEAI